MDYEIPTNCIKTDGYYMDIILASHFNSPIKGKMLPFNVTKITFGSCFNQTIDPDSLPKMLTHLTFGNNFDQLI